MWKMLKAENAIELMVIQIRFKEALPSLAANRVLRAIEPAASAAGLINRQPIQTVQLDLKNLGARSVNSNGMVFQKTSLVRVEGEVVNQLSSQVEFQPSLLTYTNWIYSSWTRERDASLNILRPALELAVQSVALDGIRLEYVDRFIFMGEGEKLPVSDLLREDSDFISQQIFNAEDLFHSHTGRFEEVTTSHRLLQVLNIDAQEIGPPSAFAGHRSIAVTTITEEQYIGAGLELDRDKSVEHVSETLDKLHASALALFRGIIDNDFANSQGLSA